MSEFFGPHLTLDLGKCDFEVLVDFERLYDLLANLPAMIGMTRISEPQLLKYVDKWAKTPGVTGVVILAESHISIHTFPDSRHVFMDIFSCRNFDTQKTIDFLVDFFHSREPVINIITRGIDFNKVMTEPFICQG